MLGAVGAYEWNGTVVMHTDQGTMVPLNADFHDPLDERKESLAGYVGKYKRHTHTAWWGTWVKSRPDQTNHPHG
jgi:hypothetical protein